MDEKERIERLLLAEENMCGICLSEPNIVELETGEIVCVGCDRIVTLLEGQ